MDRIRNRPQSILFSNTPWEEEIRRTFRQTRHRIGFAKLDGNNGGAFDLVVPLNIPESKRLSDNPGLYPRNRLPLPDSRLIALYDDKPAFFDHLRAEGLTRYIPSGDRDKLPLMLKVKVGGDGKGCHLILSEEDQDRHANKLDSPDYFIQQMIPGRREYATHMLMSNGRLQAALGVEYEFDKPYPIKGQDKPVAVRLQRDPFLDDWVRLLARHRYEGLCCVNYKILEGQPLLLELNPRFGGSLALFFFSFLRHLPPA